MPQQLFPGSRSVQSSCTLSVNDCHLTIDTSNGALTVTFATISSIIAQSSSNMSTCCVRFIDAGGVASANNITFVAGSGDLIGNQSSITVNVDGAMGQFLPLGLNTWAYIPADVYYPENDSVIQLTDAATVAWNTKLGSNSYVTLAGNRSLAISNAVMGRYYTIKVIQDSTGSRTLSLPTTPISSKVVAAGAGAITLTPTGNAYDILTMYYDGTYFNWTYGNNFT